MSESYKQYVLKDTSTGKYYPSGQPDWPFVDDISKSRVFARRTSALYAKHADLTRAKEKETDPHDKIPNIDDLEPQPVSLREV